MTTFDGKTSASFYISTHILTKRMTVLAEVRSEAKIISTHILTKRMTSKTIVKWSGTSFQLTSSRRGWRHTTQSLLCISRAFQLTSSRRGWLCGRIEKNSVEHFNSHPHEEDDWIHPTAKKTLKHFNSHPHEEDDGYLSGENHIYDISTHILTKRMTVQRLGVLLQTLSFQLTSSRRGWQVIPKKGK